MTEVFMRRISDRLRDRILSRFITSLVPSGKVVFMDDFAAAALKWDSVIVGTGTIARDTVDAFEGDAALKVATTSGANDETKAFRTVGQSFYKRSPLGIELWLNPKSISVGSDVQLGFQWYDGVNAHSAVLRYLTGAVNPGWYVKENGDWQMFSDVPTLTRLRGYHYHHVKMVADLAANRYCWAFIDGLFFDLYSHAIDVSSSSLADALEFFMSNRNNGVGTAQSCWWANIIATYLEPAQLGAF